MNKRLLPSIVSIVFLGLMICVGFIQFFTHLRLYGWSYEVAGETVSTFSDLGGCILLTWFLAISIQNYRLIDEKAKRGSKVE